MPYSSKLIVLRGNSGSGKTTAAYKIREVTGRKIAIVEQDYVRRKILGTSSEHTRIDLMKSLVTFGLNHGYDVILEGILSFKKYAEMLKYFADICRNHHFFYFDMSFEETLRRHATKPNAHEFGEQEMKGWFKNHDVTGYEGEIIIPETFSQEDTLRMIIRTAGL